MAFAVEITNLVKELKVQHELVISNQIGRSETSIGANIRETNCAQGKKDFVSNLESALKEANETTYWLERLHRTGYITRECFDSMEKQCRTILVMLVASCKTAKGNL